MSESRLPWYKQPLVWMLIAIPASAVIAGIHMIYLAVTTADGLVVDEYYKHGLLINDQIERDRYAWELGLSAEVMIDPGNGYVSVRLDQGALSTLPASIELALRHAMQEREDNSLRLYKGGDDRYEGVVAREIRRGVWYLEISDVSGGTDKAWRLSQKTRIDTSTRVQLLPLAPVGGP